MVSTMTLQCDGCNADTTVLRSADVWAGVWCDGCSVMRPQLERAKRALIGPGVVVLSVDTEREWHTAGVVVEVRGDDVELRVAGGFRRVVKLGTVSVRLDLAQAQREAARLSRECR